MRDSAPQRLRRNRHLARPVPAGTSDNPARQENTSAVHARLHTLLAAGAAGICAWNWDAASDMVTLFSAFSIDTHCASEPVAPCATLSTAEWLALVVPEDRQAVAEEWCNARERGQPFHMEYRVRLNGSPVWLLVRGLPAPGGSAPPERIGGVVVEINERKAAEDAAHALQERYRLLTELNPDGMLVHVDGVFAYANQAAIEILGAPDIREVLGRSPFEFIHPEAHQAVKEKLASVLERNDTVPLMNLRIRRMDGSPASVQAAAGKVSWNGKSAVQLLLRDITEQVRTEDKLRVMNERLKLVLEGSGEGIWDWDLASDTYTVSDSMKRIVGWKREEPLRGKIDWSLLVHPDDLGQFSAALRACLSGKKAVYECEFRLATSAGKWKWVLARGAVVARDDRGNPVALTGTLLDISARKESQELVWRHANLDPLTGLPNRRMFRDRLDAEVRNAHRGDKKLALLFIDLDGFKQVNDLFGHDAGDLLLKEAAHRLRNCVRETDVVSRLGGDEFTVVLTGLAEPHQVEFVCEKVLASLARPFALDNDVAYVTGSIGVSVYPADGSGSEDLIRKADQAMYAAKDAGKNQFSYFTRAMDEKAHAHLRLSSELRQALASGQLSLHYQPVVDLVNGQVIKAEALLRWQHPALGNVPPSTFVPLAEESGLIGAIGNWAFREAAACSKRCSEQAGKVFPIGINKSPLQFMLHNRDSDWLQHLAELGIPGNSILIEITESLLLNPSQNVNTQLLEYRDAGVMVAIDDFGTGYSSLSYLHHFDIDFLKIDQSFVQDIDLNPSHRAITETIIMMAHKLGLKVIAEGIETREQTRILADAGCDYGQGFYFSPAVPEQQLGRMLSGRFPT